MNTPAASGATPPLVSDGYYLLHGDDLIRPTPVEVHTIATSPRPRQFVRGLNVACTLRRAIEKGYTFQPLDTSCNLVEQTVGNLEHFEQDASDLDKVL